MDNYMDSTSPEYVRRMASALDAKWEALAPYVSPGVRVLDYGCGMPIQDGIRERVEAVGGVYECHDISTTVETAMWDAGIAFRTKEDLQERAGGYDVVFLSSVVHELTGQDTGFEEMEAIWRLVADGGVAIVRDWAGTQFQLTSELPRSLKLASEDAMREVLTWVGALALNSIIHVGNVNNYRIDWDNLELHANPATIYEIAFHSVWGLGSLPRESAEWYGDAQGDLNMHLRYWGDCTVERRYDEWDESYLKYFQRLYDIDRLPWPTKTVLVLRRTK